MRGMKMRSSVATLLLCYGVTVSNALMVTPLSAARRRMSINSAVQMSINGTRPGPVDPVEVAKAAREQREQQTRLARQNQEEAQRAWQTKQAREEQHLPRHPRLQDSV